MTQPRPTRRRSVLTGLSALPLAPLLAGCLGSSAPPPRRFYLSALSEPPPRLAKVDWSLVVEPPQTVPALRTRRIALAFAPNEFDHYAGTEWGDLPTAMVQALIIRSFQTSGAIDVVANARQGLRPDYILKSWLVPFFAEGAKKTAPIAKVGLDLQLMKTRNRTIVATRAIEHAIQAEGPNIEAIIKAFDQAMTATLNDLVPWTLETGKANA